jgi:ATP-dependent Clp protease ATP-binding subunit ClpA
VEVLDVRADPPTEWTKLDQQMTAPRSGCAASFDAAHGKLYVVGGWDGSNCVDKVEVLDTTPPAVRMIRAQVLADEQEMAQPVEVETWDTLFGGDRKHSKFVGQATVRNDLREALQAFKSICVLFEGPSGLGKTELAGSLAEVLSNVSLHELKKRGKFVKVPCAQMKDDHASGAFFGVHDGIVGGAGGLYNAIEACPEVIILFDEFDKMNPALFATLLPVLDTKGEITSNKPGNAPLSTSKVTFIFTTN